VHIPKIEPTKSAYRFPLLIKQLLLAAMRNHLDQEIVYRDLRRMTYREFNRRLGQLANALGSLGVKPGEIVGVLDWDSHRYLECYFAVPMMGSVLQTVNVRLSPEQIFYTLNHAKPTTLLINEEFLPLYDSIKADLKSVERVILLTDKREFGALPSGVAAEYESLLAKQSTSYDFPDFDENACATLFYTTGTTGLPKGVFFSHRQHVLHAISELAALALSPRQCRIDRDSVYMPVTPMFHVHAWGFPYSATCAGMKQVYPGRYAPDMLLKLIKTEKVTFTHGVPTILQMLLTACEAAETDLKGVTMIIGGSALPKALAKRALEVGLDICTGYGMSETGPLICVAHLETDMLTGNLDEEIEHRTKTGRVVPLVDLRIVDPEMNELPRDGVAVGEIVLRAPWLTQGYLHNEDASEKLWAGGYLHTDDIANVDQRGYVQITDRIKDVIKTGGEWVSSLEVEDIISQCPGVREAAVIGVKDEKWGERPLAIVVREQGDETADEGKIADHMKAFVSKGIISKFAIPQQFKFVEQLPKTSVGKLDKKALRKTYGDQ
jgi:fatty-acyl-CoA synthase